MGTQQLQKDNPKEGHWPFKKHPLREGIFRKRRFRNLRRRVIQKDQHRTGRVAEQNHRRFGSLT